MGFLSWLGLKPEGTPLDVGAKAPDAIVFDTHGAEVHLAKFYWEGFVLVYFYPKADTPGCTKQACSLRDEFEKLKDRNVDIIGISADVPNAIKKFREKHKLPFVLLADPERHAGEAFGVPRIAGMYRRQTFLIRAGRVVWRDLHASTSKQAADVLKVLDGMKS